jgi:phage shock protein A
MNVAEKLEQEHDTATQLSSGVIRLTDELDQLREKLEQAEQEESRLKALIAEADEECGSLIWRSDHSRILSKSEARIKELEQELTAIRERDRWIPVSEKLPEVGQEVEIFTTSMRRFIVIRDGNYFEFCLQGTRYAFHWQDDVTHWRPLPAPPAEHAQEQSQ